MDMTMGEFDTLLERMDTGFHELHDKVNAMAISLAACQSASGARAALNSIRSSAVGTRSSWVSAVAALIASGAALFSVFGRH